MIPAGYKEVQESTPAALTTAITKTSLFPLIAERWVTSYIVRVRSMGTATYVGIGDINGQDYRMTVIGQIKGWSGNPGELLNLSKVFYIADTADAVIELIANYYDDNGRIQ